MADEPTTHDVYVNAVRDHLNGTPNASHPVQFEATSVQGVAGELATCTFCGALVLNLDRCRDLHRAHHDRHNRVHQGISDDLARHGHAEKVYR